MTDLDSQHEQDLDIRQEQSREPLWTVGQLNLPDSNFVVLSILMYIINLYHCY